MDFNILIDRKGTHCYKWESTKPFQGKEVLPFWIADMDIPAPPGVTAALQNRAAHPVYGYTMMPAALIQAVVDWNARRHGWKIEREWLLTTPGVIPALCSAVMAYSQPGDEIIIQPPVYPPFAATIANNQRVVVENPLTVVDGRYTFDFDDLQRKVTNKTKCLILCSPHNPVGRVWTAEELTRLSDFCLANGIILIADEIHSDLVFAGHKHTPAAALSAAAASNTLVMTAASKTFNLAGTATSFVIIPDPDKRRRFQEVNDALAYSKIGSLFGYTAAEAAYQTGEPWLDELLLYLADNARYLSDYVTQNIPGVKVVQPEGTFLAWLDFRQITPDPAALDQLLIDRAKVGLNKGHSFGASGAGFARMNFACPRSLLHEGLTRIEHAVKER